MENIVNCSKCNKKISFESKAGKGVKVITCDKCGVMNKVALCPECGSSKVYGISRVVGYYSKINNWNRSKTAEFVDRQKGDYKF